ncbi:MAG: hypothetical protein ABJA70_22030 [Chryseolinea sp.]
MKISQGFAVFARAMLLVILFHAALSCLDSNGQPVEKGLFDSEEVLDLKLSGNIRNAMRDRSGKAEYQNMRISYGVPGDVVTVPVRVKTRGHFRLTEANCLYPPLMLNFSRRNASRQCLFNGLNKIKLVTTCKAERYVVHEYLVYKLYNIVTEKSLKARLVQVTFEDTVKQRSTDPTYGILLEEDEDMAKRHQGKLVEGKLMRPEDTHKNDFMKLAVFEYLIGNTDWSIQYQQNIKLIAIDSINGPTAVAYDFDHAGIVRASYAKPAPELELPSTIVRRYRGYCIDDMRSFEETFSFYNSIKEQIYGVYKECAMIDEGYRKSTMEYLDDFFTTINDPKKAAADFKYPCYKSGTGNVVITGLKKQ